MKTHNESEARKTWARYRSTFQRRRADSPALAHLLPIIDRICESGYAEVLYASTSLDNLVISPQPRPHDRRGTILVIPKESVVDFRLYRRDGTTEPSQVSPDHVEAEIDRLVPKLIQDQEEE